MTSDAQPIAHLLARFAVDQRADPTLVERFGEDIRGRIVDVLGNSLAATTTAVFPVTSTVVRTWGGAPRATAIGLDDGVPTASAAFHNGTLAHALDFDDTHLPSVLHPSASVIPAVLATAEAVGASYEAVVAAAVVGIEITNRLGMAGYDDALGNSVFFERGLHATSICGTLGSAVAVAMLLGGDQDVIGHSIGIAASMGAGLLEANRTGGTVKKVHCGWAAHSGTVAAELAVAGLTGPPTVLEGRFGFLQAHCGDRVDLRALTDNLGTDWTLGAVGFKPYPCNIYTHPVIDAALQLRERGITADQLDWVEAGVAKPTLRTIAEPPAKKASPETGYEAQFSGPYAFAAAMLGGGGLGVSLEDFTDAAAVEPRRRALAARVRMVDAESATAAFPRRISCVLRYCTQQGEEGEITIPVNRGFGARTLTADEHLTKFRTNASTALPAQQVEALEKALQRLPHLSMTDLMSGLRQLAPTHGSPERKGS
ncbi:MmgE/PrpD family protein [Actinopolymorpha pittospori]|uniref:2-methylcitrate dehydratase PrpD n=1 Tax=Actinopolymorpha pittospori TaxID=648752 RepID=A0A927N816_9ACTN|nr:MmgE/PrpD family protein [Actinopolymorpha pittospori]MBE1610135.1 2-methylcitrate dehydratase PrpD [Actinopolymorpha pittospori]